MTTISTAGGNTVNIFDSNGTLFYNINGGSATTLTWPVTVTNNNTSAGILKVLFTTNITVNNTNCYFSCNSDKIQFGSETIESDGSRRTITVTVDNYDGLILNGASGVDGKNNITVYNLIIEGEGHTTQVGAGWIGHKYFGNGSTGNYIVNCSSSGEINGGGILGDFAENVTLRGCSSSGEISDQAGGIVGAQVDSVVIQLCWSTGAISGDGAGGIAGANVVNAEIEKCYSEGILSGNNTGGIIGGNAGQNSVTITKCYSRGAIQGSNAGGICGSLAALDSSLSVTITNCYSTGNQSNSQINLNGGICGLLSTQNPYIITLTITNCYTTGTCDSTGYIIGNKTTIIGSSSAPQQFTLSNNFSEAGSAGGSAGSWNNTNANLRLAGIPETTPGAGTTWAATAINTAYELVDFGATPYQRTVISNNGLIQGFSQTVEQGSSSIVALNEDASGNEFRILKKTGGDAGSYHTIMINAQTGAISTMSTTAVGTYILTVRSTGSYYITTFVLTIIGPGSSSSSIGLVCCTSTMDQRGLTYEEITSYKIGNRLLLEVSQNSKTTFDGYSDYVKYKMAQGSRKF